MYWDYDGEDWNFYKSEEEFQNGYTLIGYLTHRNFMRGTITNKWYLRVVGVKHKYLKDLVWDNIEIAKHDIDVAFDGE